MTEPTFDPDPAQLAGLVSETSDEQLAEGLRVNRDAILAEVFRQMPARFDAGRAGDLDAVVEWRIGDRPDGGHDRFQVVIERGECRIEREGSREPRVTYTIGAVDFLRLVTGDTEGPKLFLFGKLKVGGDLFLAARMPRLFRIPRADS